MTTEVRTINVDAKAVADLVSKFQAIMGDQENAVIALAFFFAWDSLKKATQ